jgi:hypothetical protein
MSGHERELRASVERKLRCTLLAIPLLAVTSGCEPGCTDTTVAEARAPEGQLKAVLFQRDCGATTGFSTQVSVLKSTGHVSGSGNAFRADDNHGAAAIGTWGGPWAEIRWLTSEHLLIRYAEGSRIFEQSNAVSGVTITYEAVSR